jgi:putative hydrolase of the HAD superfamily
MQSITSLDALVFDLDYTLFDEHQYFFAVLEAFCIDANCLQKLDNLKKDYFILRSISQNIFKEMLQMNDLYSSGNEELLFQKYCSIKLNLNPYPDAVSFLTHLKEETNIKIGLLTNGNIDAQANKIRTLQISNFFDEIVYARKFGREMEKPNPISFQFIKQKLKSRDNEIGYIGDNPRTDFEGAKKVKGITYRILRGLYESLPTNQFIDYQFINFNELE